MGTNTIPATFVDVISSFIATNSRIVGITIKVKDDSF